jgi:hypothetical protein
MRNHSLFFKSNGTGSFGIPELHVYQQNNLIQKIKSALPSKEYSEDYLKLNNFTTYYRTYPKWSLDCQNVYST